MARLSGDIPQNVNVAIEASVVRIFLDADKVKCKTRASKTKLDPADVGEQSYSYKTLVKS